MSPTQIGVFAEITCRHCADRIAQIAGPPWFHILTGLPACSGGATRAEPSP